LFLITRPLLIHRFDLIFAFVQDGTKVFSASADKTVKAWDLNSNQCVQVAQHDGPVKTVHWIKAPNYQCLMTGSWDKTLKFWDMRSPNPIMTVNLPERVYCADVVYPMAVVGLAQKSIFVYQLEGQPSEYKRVDSNLKFQSRCISIFSDKKSIPCGFALGSVEGRVSIQYVNGVQNPKENFTFKCHRSNGVNNGCQDIYAVNDISFHPQHGTLSTVGSDGRYSFWDKDARTKLKSSDQMEQPINRCAFSARGEVFAYAVGYDWSRGHEFATPGKKNGINLHACFEDLKPKIKK
jgi:mRNA export factor